MRILDKIYKLRILKRFGAREMSNFSSIQIVIKN